jgi:tRNA threonylcarbamoyladenosine biosynthesis protein TsaE
MNMNNSITLANEQAMLDFGGKIAKHISAGLVIFVNGDLGAGKTTLVRGFLRQLGYNGAVKSPTFTLVESYTLNNIKLETNQKLEELLIYHFDLYRLCDPEELDYMGMSDYLDGQAVVFIEWPEKGD